MRWGEQPAALCTSFARLCGCEAALFDVGVVRTAAEGAGVLAEGAGVLAELAEVLALLSGDVVRVAAERLSILAALRLRNVVRVAAELAAELALTSCPLSCDDANPQARNALG